MQELIPKGTLIPIGGGEDREHEKDVLCRIIKETRKRKPLLCMLIVATSEPEEAIASYKKAFKNIGHTKVEFIYYTVREEADSEKFIELARNCAGVLIGGGDQLRLSSLLGGTELLGVIKRRYMNEPNFVVAGTSAGAAAMSNTMIISGSSLGAMIKGELQLTNGLDFINNIFIDTHFTERGRFGRVIQTLTYNPNVLGIGLGEDTAIVVKKGRELEVVGSGLVMVADGTQIKYSDIMEREDGETITVEGIKIHVLGPRTRFLIKERRIKRKSTTLTSSDNKVKHA